MTSNYKFANHAYSIENYDLTHDQVHKMKNAIDKNYEEGGGFGYICIPKPNSDVKSNFNDPTKVECAPVFVSKDLIPRDNDKKALNVKNYHGEDYLVLANGAATGTLATPATPASIKAATTPAITTFNTNLKFT